MSDQTAAPHTTIQPESPSEAAYVGALLAGRIVAGESLYLDKDEFTSLGLRVIYEAARERLQTNQPFDIELIARDIDSLGDLPTVGGSARLYELAAQHGDINSAVLEEHAGLIHRAYIASLAVDLANEILQSNSLQLDKTLAQISERALVLRGRLAMATVPRYSTAAALDELLGSIEWLWPSWILRGFVTCLVAQQGQGKSYAALDLCARLLAVSEWPDHAPMEWNPNSFGQTSGEPFKLLWIDTEMALAALSDRLSKFGIDKERFILPEDPLRQLKLDNEADRRWIENAIAHFRPPLVVIDSLSGAHNAEEKDNGEMKVILSWLSGLAQTYKIAIIVIHHIRKAGVGETDWPITIDRVRGASAITQLTRSVIALGTPDKTQPRVKRVEVIKTNFGEFPEPLGFEIVNSLPTWGEAPDVPKATNAAEDARAFLIEFLSQGMRLSSDVFAAAEAEGISSSTLKRASKELKVKPHKEQGRDGRWFWNLPGRPNQLPPNE